MRALCCCCAVTPGRHGDGLQDPSRPAAQPRAAPFGSWSPPPLPPAHLILRVLLGLPRHWHSLVAIHGCLPHASCRPWRGAGAPGSWGMGGCRSLVAPAASARPGRCIAKPGLGLGCWIGRLAKPQVSAMAGPPGSALASGLRQLQPIGAADRSPGRRGSGCPQAGRGVAGGWSGRRCLRGWWAAGCDVARLLVAVCSWGLRVGASVGAGPPCRSQHFAAQKSSALQTQFGVFFDSSSCVPRYRHTPPSPWSQPPTLTGLEARGEHESGVR